MDIINGIRHIGGCAYGYFNNQNSQKNSVYRVAGRFFFQWGQGAQIPFVATSRIYRALTPSEISSVMNRWIFYFFHKTRTFEMEGFFKLLRR